jgi:LysM repeat protein
MTIKTLAVAATLAISVTSVYAASDSAVAYTVTENEDIETIAGTYDVSVEDILVTNGKTAEEIEVGSVIYIPPAHATGRYNPDNGTYKVAKGDDLYAISNRFGTSVASIETLNGMKGNEIKAGATIKIPQ